MGMAQGAWEDDMARLRARAEARRAALAERAQEQSASLARARPAADAARDAAAGARADRALEMRGRETAERLRMEGEQAAFSRGLARDRFLADCARQRGELNGYRQVAANEAAAAEGRATLGRETVAALMKTALDRGQTPVSALALATRRMGLDGKTQAIGGAGFMENGDFYIDYIQKDPRTGQIRRTPNVMKFEQLGGVLYRNPGIFTDSDRAGYRKGLYKRGYTTQEVNRLCGIGATGWESLGAEGRANIERGSLTAAGGGWEEEYRRRAAEAARERDLLNLRRQRIEVEALAEKARRGGLTDKGAFCVEGIENSYKLLADDGTPIGPERWIKQRAELYDYLKRTGGLKETAGAAARPARPRPAGGGVEGAFLPGLGDDGGRPGGGARDWRESALFR